LINQNLGKEIKEKKGIKNQNTIEIKTQIIMHNILKIGVTVFLFVILLSCDSNKVYEEYVEIDNGVWERENIISFDFEAEDTTTAHNTYINIRNTGDYPYSNVYLFVKMEGPSGNLLIDTVNCILADNRGIWLGSGIGDLWDLKIPYFGGFKFAQKGKYRVSFEQAMRVEDGLKGITDVGIRVEKAKH
jgi:gliding motility-associated lipoprotein GldH